MVVSLFSCSLAHSWSLTHSLSSSLWPERTRALFSFFFPLPTFHFLSLLLRISHPHSLYRVHSFIFARSSSHSLFLCLSPSYTNSLSFLCPYSPALLFELFLAFFSGVLPYYFSVPLSFAHFRWHTQACKHGRQSGCYVIDRFAAM